jgi:hypothetical protein
MTDHELQRAYERGIAALTAARAGEVGAFNAVLQEAADEDQLPLVAYALAGIANTAVEHLARVTGVPSAVLVEQIALAVADAPTE